MFKRTVGTSKINSLQDTSLANNVCKECAGLPLLINAIGNALKFDTENSWKNALLQLENNHFDEIDGIESPVSACIQLSFDKLKKDVKTCLLLCSLFPEDAEIEIKMLVDIATGSQLLDPRMDVRGLVDNLKSSSLLLEGKTSRTVKLHDIIRDVARCIGAREEQYAFLFIRGDSLLDHVDYRTQLLQFVESNKFRYPSGMVCPNLHTLWLECNNQPPQFSNSFFKGIVNLKILVLKGMHAFTEHICVQSFEKLTCLILDGCALNETWLSIVPENLETLRILKCGLPNPLDLSKLKCLRKLEVLCDIKIELVQNAISTLPITLEELHVPCGFRICDADGKISMPVSWELNKLTTLTSLNIQLEDSKSCPDENIVANLLDFTIDVGDKWYSHDSHMRSVMFQNTCIEEGGGEVLVERAEEVILMDVKGLQNGFSRRSKEAFSNLKMLSIESCEDMEHLAARMPHDEIQQSQPLTSFSKLTSLAIYGCKGLKYIFSASVAKYLVQLQELHVDNCPTLQQVIRNDSAFDGPIMEFPKLKSSTLQNLDGLRSFHYGENRGSSSSSTTITDIAATLVPAGPESLFDGKVALPALESLTIWNLKASEIWEKNGYKNNSFCQLKFLHISYCRNLEIAIPVAMLPTFQNLEKFTIDGCESMISEVENSSSNGSSNAELPLVALHSIHLFNLPALTQTRLNSTRRNLYPNLETLDIFSCHRLRNVFLPSIAKHLVRLKYLCVYGCHMSEIIGEEDSNNELVFPELRQLILRHLPNLKRFCFNESMKVGSCGVSALFSCSVFMNLHQLQELTVKECPLLQEVVREENNIVDTSEITISLLQLKSIELGYLSKLKCFSQSSNYAFSMPALKSISVCKCPQMESFTSLELSTPLMPNFHKQIQIYLNSPNRVGEEEMKFTC